MQIINITKSNESKSFWLILLVFVLTLINSGCDQIFRDPHKSKDRVTDLSTTAPRIFELFVAAISSTSAIVYWQTDKPAYATVDYGKDKNYGTSVQNSSYTVAQSVELTRLTPGTNYYFQVKAIDGVGNVSMQEGVSFATEPVFFDTNDIIGPDTTNFVVNPNPTTGVSIISLTATISDSNSGGSAIGAAEYFMETQGVDGMGIPLSANDGSFNSGTENVSENINISGWLTDTTKRIYVHGKDSNNNWGPVKYVDVTVTSIPVTDTTGPVTTNLSLNPNPTVGATNVTLSATISDLNTGGSVINGAEYFIDTQGGNGTGALINATDGTFNSVSEDVTVNINITGWSVGTTKRVFVHGKDNTNWGTVQYVDVNVTSATINDITGPVTSNAIATPNPTAGAGSITLTATINDTNTGGSVVSAAEYFIDTQGTNGTGISLTVANGSFTSPTENVIASVNTTGWTVGTTKRIYVHGKDNKNNWGTAQLVNVSVTAGDTTGPVTSNVVATPNPTVGAGSITLTAALSDTNTGGSVVSAAEYFIDTQGTNGSGTTLNASDGNFNTVSENVTITINTTGWVVGTTKRIYVHGKDNKNNWGTVQSVAVSITSATVTTKPDFTSQTVVSYGLGTYTGRIPQQAVWIEDSAGNFIRTLYVSRYATQDIATLPTWYGKSAGNSNGTSGATRTTGTYQNNWSCIDKNNSIVPAGNYRYRIETRQQGGAGAATRLGTIDLGSSSANTTGTTGGFITSFSATYAP